LSGLYVLVEIIVIYQFWADI